MCHINEEDYFRYLLSTYEKLVYSMCYRLTNNLFNAQDLTQETFLSVYRKLDTFDRDFEKAWITKIAMNKCLDFLKSASRKCNPVEETFFYEKKDEMADPENQYLQKEVKQMLLEACNRLKNPYKEIALEHFYHEKSIKEIAQEKKKGIKTIQTQVYRAKKMLKSIMEGGRIVEKGTTKSFNG